MLMFTMLPEAAGFGNTWKTASVFSGISVVRQPVKAVNAFAFPYPYELLGTAPVYPSTVVQDMIAFLMSMAVAVGFFCKYRAAIPATPGLAAEVPPPKV